MFDNRLSEINSENTLNIDALKNEFVSPKKIVKAITHSPHLFKELCNSMWFIDLINKFKIHTDLALINEEIALMIFNNRRYYPKLDENRFTKIIGEKYEGVALKILSNKYHGIYCDDNLLILGKHANAANLIFKDDTYCALLSANELASIVAVHKKENKEISMTKEESNLVFTEDLIENNSINKNIMNCPIALNGGMLQVDMPIL
jgi:hypothetical protein